MKCSSDSTYSVWLEIPFECRMRSIFVPFYQYLYINYYIRYFSIYKIEFSPSAYQSIAIQNFQFSILSVFHFDCASYKYITSNNLLFIKTMPSMSTWKVQSSWNENRLQPSTAEVSIGTIQIANKIANKIILNFSHDDSKKEKKRSRKPKAGKCLITHFTYWNSYCFIILFQFCSHSSKIVIIKYDN